jgi:hypothetical protein
VKRVSQRSAESRGFSPGAPISFHMQGKLTGWVRINTVRDVIPHCCKNKQSRLSK